MHAGKWVGGSEWMDGQLDAYVDIRRHGPLIDVPCWEVIISHV